MLNVEKQSWKRVISPNGCAWLAGWLAAVMAVGDGSCEDVKGRCRSFLSTHGPCTVNPATQAAAAHEPPGGMHAHRLVGVGWRVHIPEPGWWD